MTLAPGTKLGPYEILARIGAGRMREVWKARDTRLGRIVAIKKVREPHSERFKQEVFLLPTRFGNHPNPAQAALRRHGLFRLEIPGSPIGKSRSSIIGRIVPYPVRPSSPSWHRLATKRFQLAGCFTIFHFRAGTVALFARRNLNGSTIRRAAARVGRRSRCISGQRRIDRAAGPVFGLDEWSSGLSKRRQPIDAAFLV
jgi:hypothetical protein